MINVNIITLTFNSENRLVNCLDSLHKNIRGIEIALSSCNLVHYIKDGGSEDSTIKILTEYNFNKNIETHLIFENDHGIYDGMNQVLQNINNGFITFLHSDDEITSGFFEVICNPMICFFQVINTSVIIINNNKITKKNGKVKNVIFKSPLNHMSLIYRVDLHESIGFYPTSFNSFGDLVISLRLLKYKILELNTATRIFYHGGLSTRKRENSDVLNKLKIIYRIIKMEEGILIGILSIFFRIIIEIKNKLI